MTASETQAVPAESGPVPVRQVEAELARRLKALQRPGEAPVLRACLSNLVIFCQQEEAAEQIAGEVPTIATLHPARILLLVGKAGSGAGELTASVCVRPHELRSRRRIYSEQVTLRASGRAVERLPYAVRALVMGDLPINFWWAVPEPPSLAGPLLYDLAEHAQQIIYDSIGWLEPARGVSATASWLGQAEDGGRERTWRLASDLNWRRLKSWRRLLAQALEPTSAPGALDSITEVLLEHGPHAVIQAWELASWLGSRLGWRVDEGIVQPGVEIFWQVHVPHEAVRLRIHRLGEGPSEIRRVRIACKVGGRPGALNFTVQDEHRLAVVPEKIEGVEARTITFQRPRTAELVARQLSDRERDPVFYESMAVARVLAETVFRSG